MKILAFTDHHGSPNDFKFAKKKAKGVDLILHMGDFTIFEHEIEAIMAEMNNMGKPVLFIHGNHEDDLIVEYLCKKFKNLKFIHKKHYEIDGVVFLGYGGGGFSMIDKEFEKHSKKFEKAMKGKKTILMLHGPPYGTKADIIMGDHVGNESFTKFIKKNQPEIVLCGHLHENFHVKSKIKKSVVINPGPDGEIIEI